MTMPWGTTDYQVDSETYSDLWRDALIAESYGYPTPPKPPVKSITKGFFSEKIEYDHHSPIYLKEYEEYENLLNLKRAQKIDHKTMNLWAPWGCVQIRRMGEDA